MHKLIKHFFITYLKTVFFNIYAYVFFRDNDEPCFALVYNSGDKRENLSYKNAHEMKKMFGGKIIESEYNESYFINDKFLTFNVSCFWFVFGLIIFLLFQWYTPSIL